MPDLTFMDYLNANRTPAQRRRLAALPLPEPATCFGVFLGGAVCHILCQVEIAVRLSAESPELLAVKGHEIFTLRIRPRPWLV